MDTPSPQLTPQVVQCQCRCRRSGWGVIGGFFRFIGLIILFVLVFTAGLVIGGSGPANLLIERAFTWDGSSLTGPGMMQRSGAGGYRMQTGERAFGVITAIAGQKITIADNGGGTQTVTASSQTIVLDGDREVPVWTLRVGNAVRIFGPAEAGGISAHMIAIIR